MLRAKEPEERYHLSNDLINLFFGREWKRRRGEDEGMNVHFRVRGEEENKGTKEWDEKE